VRAGLAVALTETTPDFLASRRQRRAADKAFALRRIELVQEGRESPLKRVAALFAVLSNNNTYEGRDPNLIADSIRCGVVADYLNLSVDELASVLVDLETWGLIEPGPGGGIRLKNVAALETLADV